MKQFSNYYKTDDEEQLFFSTNFPHEEEIGKLIVFNYGLVCSNHHWKEQLDYFDQQGYKILIHDYRAHFESSGKENIDKVTFKQLAQDLNQIIEHINPNTVQLIGHSMGVNVCLEFANQFPKKLSSMILISGTILPVHNIMLDTSITGLFKPKMKELLKLFPKETEGIWKLSGKSNIMKKVIYYGGFNVDNVDEEFIEVYLNKVGALGFEIFVQLLDQMHEHNALSFIENIKTKTLIIGGNKDKVIPNYLQRILHEHLSNSELYTLHKGSHVPQVDFPEMINERMNYFLASE